MMDKLKSWPDNKILDPLLKMMTCIAGVTSNCPPYTKAYYKKASPQEILMSPTVTSLPNGLLRKGLYKIIPKKYATLFQLAFEYLRFIS